MSTNYEATVCLSGQCNTAAFLALPRGSASHAFWGKMLSLLVQVRLTPALLFRQTSRYRELKVPTSNPHGFLQVGLNIQSYSFLQPFYFYFFPAAFSVLLSNVPKNHSFIHLPLGHQISQQSTPGTHEPFQGNAYSHWKKFWNQQHPSLLRSR